MKRTLAKLSADNFRNTTFHRNRDITSLDPTMPGHHSRFYTKISGIALDSCNMQANCCGI